MIRTMTEDEMARWQSGPRGPYGTGARRESTTRLRTYATFALYRFAEAARAYENVATQVASGRARQLLLSMADLKRANARELQRRFPAAAIDLETLWSTTGGRTTTAYLLDVDMQPLLGPEEAEVFAVERELRSAMLVERLAVKAERDPAVKELLDYVSALLKDDLVYLSTLVETVQGKGPLLRSQSET
ncbi:MAG: hypothetical protein GF331_14710 [Chitinivibrionales bacterium]|nr:hypothetical protein [Chitinivibrionales bacterium]